MIIVGITGSFATGKTTVTRMLSKRGAIAIDADRIARKLIAPGGICVKPVVRYFGESIITRGAIDRKKLSVIVFNDKKALKRLCSIIHPEVIKRTKQIITYYKRHKRNSVIVIDAPLLIEAGLDRLTDILVVVKANRIRQIARASRHLGLTPYEVKKRIKAQMPIREKIRLADIVIDNRGSMQKTKRQVAAVWKKIKRLNVVRTKNKKR